MSGAKPPLFPARRTYRRGRLADAARVLPVVGAVLLMLPLLWAPQDTPAPDTGRGWTYIFVVWAGLIAAAFLIAGPLADAADRPPGQGGDGEDG